CANYGDHRRDHFRGPLPRTQSRSSRNRRNEGLARGRTAGRVAFSLSHSDKGCARMLRPQWPQFRVLGLIEAITALAVALAFWTWSLRWPRCLPVFNWILVL